MTSEQIFKNILKNDRSGEKVLKYLFDKLDKLKHRLSYNKGCPIELAEEIFMDVIWIFYKKVLEKELIYEKFKQDGDSVKNYISHIMNNRCMDSFRKEKRKKAALSEIRNSLDLVDDNNDTDTDTENKVNRLLELLDNEKCKELLIKKIKWGWPYEEIYKSMGYSSVDSAKTQKRRCMKLYEKIIKKLGIEK